MSDHATPPVAPRPLWRWVRLIVLALPLVFFLVWLPGDGATLQSAQKAGNALIEQIDPSTIRLQGTASAEVIDLDFRDVQLATQHAEFRKSIEGKMARLKGQFVPGLAADGIGVVRFQITCCLADAVPILVLVRAEAIGEIKPMDWITLEGQVQFHPRRDGTGVVPVLVVACADKIALAQAEAEPYLR